MRVRTCTYVPARTCSTGVADGLSEHSTRTLHLRPKEASGITLPSGPFICRTNKMGPFELLLGMSMSHYNITVSHIIGLTAQLTLTSSSNSVIAAWGSASPGIKVLCDS